VAVPLRRHRVSLNPHPRPPCRLLHRHLGPDAVTVLADADLGRLAEGGAVEARPHALLVRNDPALLDAVHQRLLDRLHLAVGQVLGSLLVTSLAVFRLPDNPRLAHAPAIAPPSASVDLAGGWNEDAGGVVRVGGQGGRGGVADEQDVLGGEGSLLQS